MVYISQVLTYTNWMKASLQRTTIQTSLVRDALIVRGHATNHELWVAVEQQIPGITLTCVHRITQRLRQQGIIGCTPSINGQAVLDVNILPHSHFMCRVCGKLTDIKIAETTVRSIHSQLQVGVLEDSLFLSGKCRTCVNSM